MSKDKGSKNSKKPKADKTAGKQKVMSDYKSEGKNKKDPTLNVFTPKPDSKAGGDHKKK